MDKKRQPNKQKINVSMLRTVYDKAKAIQSAEKLSEISFAIDKALDFYNEYKKVK